MINTGTAIPRIGDGENKAHGRWRLNSGSEMVMTIPGLNKKPIRTVIDLSSAKFKNDRIVALHGHDEQKIIGYWDRGDISSRGIEADLHLIEPVGNEVEHLGEAIAVAAWARSGVPIECSVGAEPSATSGQWELIPQGTTVQCNGRTYDGGTKDDLPLYVLRGGDIFESSIVTFGADSVTGRVAARRTPPVKEETAMSDTLKKLLGKHAEKHHGLVARCVAEGIDEAAIETKVHEADMATKDAEIAALKAENEALKAAKVEEKTVTTEKKVGEAVLKAAAGSEKGVTFKEGTTDPTAAPKKLSDAMKAEMAAGSTLKGFALREFCLSKNPKLERA